jgi:trypsin-like peptidase
MKKFIALFALLLCLAATLPARSQCPDGRCPRPMVLESTDRAISPVLAEKAAHATVRIYSPFGTFAGSGVRLHAEGGKEIIVTCKHLFPAWPDQVRVVGYDGKAFNAVLIGSAPEADLAAVAIASDAPATARLSEASVVANTPVFQFGWGGEKRQQRQGVYLRPGGVQAGELEFSFTPIPGDSGSGVYRVSDGALVAITNRYKKTPTGIAQGGVGVCADDVATFLNKTCLPWLRKQQAPSPTPQPKLVTEPGPAGPAGPPGPQGPQGAPGPAGKCDPAELEAITQRLQKLEATIANLNGTLRVRVEPKPK